MILVEKIAIAKEISYLLVGKKLRPTKMVVKMSRKNFLIYPLIKFDLRTDILLPKSVLIHYTRSS